MKQKINEDYSILKNPSPYQIGKAPGFVRDKMPEMELQFQLRRAEEAQTFFQKKQMIAQLEQLEQPIMNLYRELINVRNMLDEKSKLPLIPNDKLAIMNKMCKKLDKVNKFITVNLLQDLDKLTLGEDEDNQ